MSSIWSRLRNHLHVIVVVIALIIVMTWPTIRYVFDTEVFWLPTKVFDVWTKFWNAWFGKAVFASNATLYHTDLMFYPRGVSLGFHTYTIPHILVCGALQMFMPVSNAYNLTFLLNILATTLSAYIYLLYLFRHRWISLFGAVIFGCQRLCHCQTFPTRRHIHRHTAVSCILFSPRRIGKALVIRDIVRHSDRDHSFHRHIRVRVPAYDARLIHIVFFEIPLARKGLLAASISASCTRRIDRLPPRLPHASRFHGSRRSADKT